jgi:hypothetical protein
MRINPCESIHEKLIHEKLIHEKSIHEKSIHANQSMDLSMGDQSMDLSMGDTKKPLSGLLSNIFVFFDFLDEFFHEDQ